MMSEPRQAGYIPHAGPVVPTKPPRVSRQKSLMELRGHLAAGWEILKAAVGCLIVQKVETLRLVGPGKSGGGVLKVLYVGSGVNLAYLSNLMFEGVEQESLRSGVHPLRAHAQVQAHQSDDYDCVIMDLPWPASRLLADPGYVSLAPWMSTLIPLPQTWDEVVAQWSSNVKRVELRRIRKHELRYRLQTSKEAFKTFYHRYYVPYIMKRFGAEAFLDSEKDIVSVHSVGELLQIYRGDQVVGAAVLIEDGGNLSFPWIGAPVELSAKEMDGAFGALYYYMTRLAYERGCGGLDCFSTRPTLRDGVLRYKRRWGAGFDDHLETNGHILFKPTSESEALRCFVQENPVATLEGSGYVGRCLIADEPLSAARLQSCIKDLLVPGLSRLNIYALRGLHSDLTDVSKATPAQVNVSDLSQKTRPLEIWAGASTVD